MTWPIRRDERNSRRYRYWSTIISASVMHGMLISAGLGIIFARSVRLWFPKPAGLLRPGRLVHDWVLFSSIGSTSSWESVGLSVLIWVCSFILKKQIYNKEY